MARRVAVAAVPIEIEGPPGYPQNSPRPTGPKALANFL
jgi:hypothetical protein